MEQNMAYVKKIVCLANSRKTSGRCIAGRELTDDGIGPWVRPVSKRETREISEIDRRYENGRRASILDIIEIPMLEPTPLLHHAEDHLIDEDEYWVKTGEAGWETVKEMLEPNEGPLWFNGSSTYHGANDKIPEEVAATLDSSLKLVRPSDLNILVRVESGFEGRQGKHRARARFRIANETYVLQITDPKAEAEFLGRDNGTYPVDDAIVCLSLSEAWNGFVFKLVAAIFTPER
jgi:hypothetical protein